MPLPFRKLQLHPAIAHKTPMHPSHREEAHGKCMTRATLHPFHFPQRTPQWARDPKPNSPHQKDHRRSGRSKGRFRVEGPLLVSGIDFCLPSLGEEEHPHRTRAGVFREVHVAGEELPSGLKALWSRVLTPKAPLHTRKPTDLFWGLEGGWPEKPQVRCPLLTTSPSLIPMMKGLG